MSNIRLIARLDIKAPNLIKGIQLEGLRVIGDPNEYAKKYYEMGADELLYMDIVASLYDRNNLTDIVKNATKNVFIPLTVGGGVRTINDARQLLCSGADKIAVNTAAIKRPEFITEMAHKFGSQCMVLSIEAKRQPDGSWEAYTDNGRERTGKDAILWAKEGEERGAGEILITSVDREGTRKGFDVELVRKITDIVNIPVIASGGMGGIDDLNSVIDKGHVSAVAMADILHYERSDLLEIRNQCLDKGIPVRRIAR